MKNYSEKYSLSRGASFYRRDGNCPERLLLNIILLLLLPTALIAAPVYPDKAQSGKSYVMFEKSGNSFPLTENGKTVPIVFSSADYEGVKRAASDLQNDIFNVTNAKPETSEDNIPESEEIILIGSMDKSPLINALIKNKKLNAGKIKGKWEAFLIDVVENPFPGVKRALVFAGSDKRGTIYAVYDLSEKIGVSPWYWWADVPVKHHENIFIDKSGFTSTGPKVKYRGIFINDEAPALTGWAYEKFGGLNHKFYTNVFELILRLKGNYLWPAMWGNNFNDDDSLNPKLADEYGIVMGTSHHEPMMRAWKEWPKYGKGAWNYAANDSVLKEYWRDGIKRMNSYESIITLAMRGDGDEAMGEKANIGLLEKVVADQRKIIAEVTRKDVTKIPQVWALYKEVQEYYDKGMRVPDDVTLLLCDDNWGNLRRLPALASKPRKGGYGIYYHFDYVGGPRNYKWLNTVQIERVWEQMHLAYEYGARQIWIVNVGDIKPLEYPINFFLDYAWDPENISATDLPQYYRNWAAEQFGEKYSDEIAGVLAGYTKYNSRRKPELLSPVTYSLTNYREAESIVAEYNFLYDKALKISSELPGEYQDAFYQLVLHPVEACANLNDMLVTIGKNRMYAAQGRAAANELAAKAEHLFRRDADISDYYNKKMAGGKWNHMMDQTHIGYTYWQQPDKNTMPEVKRLKLPLHAEMGVAVEGSSDWWPESEILSLPEYDNFNRQSFYIEIFNRGSNPFTYFTKAEQPWINISSPRGEIKDETRLCVTINWSKAPAGRTVVPIKIEGAAKSVVVKAFVNNFDGRGMSGNTFVESNNYVSIEAEHYSKILTSGSVRWITIPGLGKTLSGITPFPVTGKSFLAGEKRPAVEYNVYLKSSGEIKVNLYFSPTLNFTNRPEGIRYAVSFDDQKPQIIKLTNNPNPPDLNRDPVWNKWVADNINLSSSIHKIEKPGNHVLKIGMVDPGIVLQKIVIDAGGEKQSYLGPPESFRVK